MKKPLDARLEPFHYLPCAAIAATAAAPRAHRPPLNAAAATLPAPITEKKSSIKH